MADHSGSLTAHRRKICTCHKCVGACKAKPGWFAPGEVKEAAAFLGLSEQEFFDRYLSVDYIDLTDAGDFMFALSPATTAAKPGGMFTRNPQGRCVFLTQEERCQIHPVKPAECRAYHCSESEESVLARKKRLIAAWRLHLDEVTRLYPNPVGDWMRDFLLFLAAMERALTELEQATP